MPNYRLAKLIDGSVVVGDLTEDAIIDVVELRLQPEDDQLKLVICPILFPYNQTLHGVSLPDSKIMIVMPVPDNILQEYLAAYSGNIPAAPEAIKAKGNANVAGSLSVVK